MNTTTCTRNADDMSWCDTHRDDMAQDSSRCQTATRRAAAAAELATTVLWTPAGPARATAATRRAAR